MAVMDVWPTDGEDGSIATEAKWRKMARLWAPDCVAAIGGQLAPSLVFPNLTVQPGSVWIDGHYAELVGSQILSVTENGLVVIRFDPAANIAELVFRDGVTTPTQTPGGIWEMPIAQISGAALIDRRLIYNPSASGVIRWNTALSFPSSTVTTTGTFFTGTITVPARNYPRWLWVNATVLPQITTIGSGVDFYAMADANNIGRVRTQSASGHSITISRNYNLSAPGASALIRAKFQMVSGSSTCTVTGTGDNAINWLQVTEVPQ